MTLPKLMGVIYCSKAKCNNVAYQVIIDETGSNYWPVCNWCLEVAEGVCAMGHVPFHVQSIPLEDYKAERDNMNIGVWQERGQFPYSYVKEGEDVL